MKGVRKEIQFVESVPLTTRVRYRAIERLRSLVHARGRRAFRAALEKLTPGPRDRTIAPNFGWLADPARPAETRIGGGVKLNHLRDAWGEWRQDFSVIYFVSSVLHLIPFPDELVAWAKSHRIPIVWNQNGVAYPSWCGNFYPWFNRPMRRLLHEADYVVYQSAFCRESADRYLGVFAGPSEVLWNPVHLGHFSLAANPAPRDPDAAWQLLAMGTNHAFYRVQSSLDCLAELLRRGHRAHLTICGELRWPKADEEVRRAIRAGNLDAHVTLLPRFTQEDAPGIYHRADVLLHPKYKDPCPTVPIEAMACGLPVVGSRSGGMPELVPHHAGRLVDIVDDWNADHSPDPKLMADAVEEVMQDREALSAGARRHAEASFDCAKWVERHREIFDSLLAK